MRLGNTDTHLTYCSNIHPGETWQAVRENLEIYTLPLKQKLSPDAPFGIGLRLSDASARELLAGNNLDELATWLEANDMYIYTLNGFPYGDFHDQVVKDKVYMPDWRTQERVDYTIRLIDILARLVPAGIEGGISTSPLSYKPWLNGDEQATENAFASATKHLADVTEYLIKVQEQTGTLIHIDIEPEPDCLIENIDETIDYFSNWLFPKGGKMLSDRLNVSQDSAVNHLQNHIQLCYDTCHFAVEFESAQDVVRKMTDAGIRIGKVQISAALKVPLPEKPADRGKIEQQLQSFIDTTYLHQVVEQLEDGSLHHYDDLDKALLHISKKEAREWRIHFHVPIFVDRYTEEDAQNSESVVGSTQADIVDALRLHLDAPYTKHLEIETYTWGVLPTSLKEDLTQSIYREYEWVLSTMSQQ